MEGNARSDKDLFKMGAAVAVGELYDSGRLGDKVTVATEVIAYLASFGLKDLEDIRSLGITGPYIEDFERLYATGAV